MTEENTLVGINSATRDKAKIHVIKYKEKYDSVTDLVTKAVEQVIEDDEHSATTE